MSHLLLCTASDRRLCGLTVHLQSGHLPGLCQAAAQLACRPVYIMEMYLVYVKLSLLLLQQSLCSSIGFAWQPAEGRASSGLDEVGNLAAMQHLLNICNLGTFDFCLHIELPFLVHLRLPA